ncbi:Hok/Gef family protein [Escherichia coli]
MTFTLLTRQTLYELRFRDGDKEVAALMACTSSSDLSLLPAIRQGERL